MTNCSTPSPCSWESVVLGMGTDKMPLASPLSTSPCAGVCSFARAWWPWTLWVDEKWQHQSLSWASQTSQPLLSARKSHGEGGRQGKREGWKEIETKEKFSGRQRNSVHHCSSRTTPFPLPWTMPTGLQTLRGKKPCLTITLLLEYMHTYLCIFTAIYFLLLPLVSLPCQFKSCYVFYRL